jgi:Inner membrane component of T3SS, cytoplasmic domain
VSRPEERELIQRLARTVGGSLTGPFPRNVLDLYRPTTIGRDPNNTIVLNDLAVAPYHAEIRLTGQGYTLRNHDAHNRTRINNQPLPAGETRVLTPNTPITVGNTTLLYQTGNRVQPGQGTLGFAPPRTPPLPTPSLNPPAQPPSQGLTPSLAPSWNAPMLPGYPMPMHPSPQLVQLPPFAYASNLNDVKIPLRRKRRGLWVLISAVILVLIVTSITSYNLLIANGFGHGPSSLSPTAVPTLPLTVAPTATPIPTSGVTPTANSLPVGIDEANTFAGSFCYYLGTFPQSAFDMMSIKYRTSHTETEFQNAPFSTGGQCTHDLPKIANNGSTVVLHVGTANYTATIIHDPASNEDLKVDSIQ